MKCIAVDDDMPALIDQIAGGRPAIALDEERGALLFFAAEVASTALLNFATRHSSGLIHAVMRSDRLDLLRIHDQPVLASEDRSLRFTVSVDAVGVGTGISARDRALTLRVLGNPDATAADLRRPGHVLPVRCPEFPFERRDQVWDMMIRAVSQSGLSPVAGACRLVRDAGDVLDETGAREFAAHFGLAVMPGR